MEQFLFTEKYRPRTIDECILPDDIKTTAKSFVAQGDLPHMILAGPSGTGKTTLALAMCDEIGVTPMFINGSEETGIDTVRTKIKSFAAALSFDGKRRYIIIDEADFLSQNSQPALRSMMEEFAVNCGFIFTCNYSNKIIPALHSRCTLLQFSIPTDEKKKLMAQTLKRLKSIMASEGVEASEELLIKIIKKWWPDVRRTINEVQRAIVDKVLTIGALGAQSDVQFSSLWDALKRKNYKDARTWIGENADVEPIRFYRTLFDWIHEAAVPNTLPTLIVLIADYQYKHISAAIDPQIHMAALTLEIMNNGAWK